MRAGGVSGLRSNDLSVAVSMLSAFVEKGNTLGFAAGVTSVPKGGLISLQKVCALPYSPSNNLCKDKEFFNEELNQCCSKCPPGTGLKIKCTHDTDSVCQPCRSGTYNQKMSYSQCFKCQTCRADDGLVYKQNCSSTTAAECVCREGWWCSLMSLSGCKMCTRLPRCPPGQGVSKKGTQNSNVVCEVCGHGTYSDQYSHTQPCMNHTNCASLEKDVLHHGNSTADTVCLSDKLGAFQSLLVPVFVTVVAVLILLMTIIAIILTCRRKGGNNNDQEVNKKFLPEKVEARHPSLSSSSSQSESIHAVCVGPVSEETKVNVNVTATINCNLHPGASTQCHSVLPVFASAVPVVKPVETDSDFPLSQEEGKEVQVAVQESGKAMC